MSVPFSLGHRLGLRVSKKGMDKTKLVKKQILLSSVVDGTKLCCILSSSFN